MKENVSRSGEQIVLTVAMILATAATLGETYSEFRAAGDNWLVVDMERVE